MPIKGSQTKIKRPNHGETPLSALVHRIPNETMSARIDALQTLANYGSAAADALPVLRDLYTRLETTPERACALYTMAAVAPENEHVIEAVHQAARSKNSLIIQEVLNILQDFDMPLVKKYRS